MHQGIYVVFEGCDFAGKSTLSRLVQSRIAEGVDWFDGQVKLTSHPGATKLGKHLRVLSKTPQVFDEEIVIDPLSRQLLMFIDQICFINTVLTPFLESGGMMLADRSNFISGIIYGLTQGADLQSLNRMFSITKSPTPDVVFVVHAPFETLVERRAKDSRSPARDVFDSDTEFLRRVCEFYDNLLVSDQDTLLLLSDYVPLERITYIDGTQPPETIANLVLGKLKDIAKIKREQA